MPGSTKPILQSVLRSALDATGATQGWLLAIDGDALVVTAVEGADADLLGRRVRADAGFAGYVASSGQPLTMSPRRDDPRGVEGVAALIGSRPASVLAVPCGTDDAVLGVIELVAKQAASPSRSTTSRSRPCSGVWPAPLSLSDVAADPAVPSPRELGDDLVGLAAADPARYAMLATFLGAVLHDG